MIIRVFSKIVESFLPSRHMEGELSRPICHSLGGCNCGGHGETIVGGPERK